MSMTEMNEYIRKCDDKIMQSITFRLMVFGNQSMTFWYILSEISNEGVDNACVSSCAGRPPNKNQEIKMFHTVNVIRHSTYFHSSLCFSTVTIMISAEAFAFWTILEFDLKTRIPCYIKNVFT